MKHVALIAVLFGLQALSFAQSTPETSGTNPSTAQAVQYSTSQITISARGLDVRTVLHDLFTQARKNFVLENVSRTELFLSLQAVDFDETLEIICRLANLQYEVQNGIYYISKVRPATAQANRNPASTPSSASAASAPANRTSGSAGTASASVARPSGRLPQTVLQRTVTGGFHRLELREVMRRLGEQAKVNIEVDERIPRYRLDFKLNNTSLGYSLRVLTERLELEFVFTEQQTILIRPKAPAAAIENLTIIPE